MSFFDFLKNNEKPKYVIHTYRTKDDTATYKFSYHQIPEGWEIDIHEQPPYLGKADDMDSAHRLLSSRDTEYKICITSGCEPVTLQYAQHVSIQWAEHTHEYIKTGVSIDDQIKNNLKNNKK